MASTYKFSTTTILLILFLFTLCSGVETITHYGFDAIGIPKTLTKSLEEVVESELVNQAQGIYKVYTRTNVDKILKENEFQLSGACLESSCLVEVGQIIGANKILSGSISKLGGTYSIVLKILDVESGLIEKTSNLQHKGEVDGLYGVIDKLISHLIKGTELKSIPKPIAKNSYNAEIDKQSSKIENEFNEWNQGKITKRSRDDRVKKAKNVAWTFVGLALLSGIIVAGINNEKPQ